MSRVLHFIYGLALIYLAIDAFFLNIIPKEFLPYMLMVLGILILISGPMTSKPIVSRSQGYVSASYAPHNRRVFKWIIGLGLIFMGVIGLPYLPLVQDFSPSSSFYDYLYGSNWVFSLVLFILGLFQLYFSTKRASTNF